MATTDETHSRVEVNGFTVRVVNEVWQVVRGQFLYWETEDYAEALEKAKELSLDLGAMKSNVVDFC